MDVTKLKRELFWRPVHYLKQHSATILSIMACGGVVGTTVLSGRATIKALNRYNRGIIDSGHNYIPTKKEVFLLVSKEYIPTAIMGLATVSCIIGANVLNKKQQASLASAYVMAVNAFKQYQNKVIQLYGEGADSEIQELILKDSILNTPGTQINSKEDEQLFFVEHGDKMFEAKASTIVLSEYNFNRHYTAKGYATVNDMLTIFGLPEQAYGDTIGWSMMGGDEFRAEWIDFIHQTIILDDGLECCTIRVVNPVSDMPF